MGRRRSRYTPSSAPWYRALVATGAVALLTTLLLAGCGGGTAGTGTTSSPANVGYITGTVQGSHWLEADAPVHALMSAEVRHDDDCGLLAATRSGTDGQFLLPVPAGTHTLRISKTGFRDETVTCTVNAGETVTLSTQDDTAVALDAVAEPRARWTVLYYIHNFNNLAVENNTTWRGVNGTLHYGFVAPQALADTLGEGVNVVVYNANSRTTDQEVPGKTLTHIRKGFQGQHEPYESEPSQVATLETFVRGAMTKYPADHYALLVANHGSGLDWTSLTERKRGIAFDASERHCITVKQLGDALRGLTAGQKIDMVVLDACLMGMMEVACEFKGSNVDYLLAYETLSNGTFPVHGVYGAGIEGLFDRASYPFPLQTTDTIDWLTGIATRTPEETAILLCYQEYVKLWTIEYGKSSQNVASSRCVVAINLTEFFKEGRIPDLHAKLAALLVQPVHGDRTIEARQKTQRVKHATDYYDLRDYCQKLIGLNPTPEVTSAAVALEEQLKPTWLFQGHAKPFPRGARPVHTPGARALLAVADYNPEQLRYNGLSTLMANVKDYKLDDLRVYQDYPQWWALMRVFDLSAP